MSRPLVFNVIRVGKPNPFVWLWGIVGRPKSDSPLGLFLFLNPEKDGVEKGKEDVCRGSVDCEDCVFK